MCGRGLKEIPIYIWALYDGLRKSHATFLAACVANSLNLGTDRYFWIINFLCVSLFLQALYFYLHTIYFSAYSLCKRFIQNFHPHPVKKNNGPSLKSISIWVRVISPATTQATFSANHWEVKPEPITSLLQPFLFLARRWIHSSVLICDWVVSLFFEQKAVAFTCWRSI